MDSNGDYGYEDTQDYPFEEVVGVGDENRIRGNWAAKTDYIFSVVGFIFALGNLCRFPCQLAEHGGVAFLVPYLTFFFLTALPILLMFVSLGPVSVWKICPLFKGVGISMVVISAIVGVYFNLITSWAVYFALNSLKFAIPWASCNNVWNTENCSLWNRATVEACRLSNGHVLANGSCLLPTVTTTTTVATATIDALLELNSTALPAIATIPPMVLMAATLPPSTAIPIPPNRVMPSLEYFHIIDFQTINWQLAIVLFVVWMFIFLASFKGIKTSGKSVYFTVSLTYIILIVLLVRMLLLPGSLDGLSFFLRPDWRVLKDLKVWGDAAVQVFYSLSTCTGGIIMLSSYNRFHNNLFSDVWIISIIDFLTSLLVSSLVFSAIGVVSYEMEFSVRQFRLQDGIQLVFVFFAEALSKLPVAQLCSFVFFLMVALITFNSELFIVETIVSSVCDEFPERLRKNHRHVLTFTLVALFSAGLALCSTTGAYWIVLLEHFVTSWPLIIIAFFEVMVVCWIYGVDDFLDNIKWMTGSYPPVYLLWKLLWKFVCPLALLVVLAFVWTEHRPLSYDNVPFPQWSIALGWAISLSPVAIIFLTAIYKYVTAKGALARRWRDLLCPEDDWGPALALHRAEMYPLQVPEARRLMPHRPHTFKQDRIEPAATGFGRRGNGSREYSTSAGRPATSHIGRQGAYALSVRNAMASNKETVI